MEERNKQIGQALLVFKEILKKDPRIKLFLIGDFTTDGARNDFFNKLEELQISSNVILTGWTENPSYYLNQCGVLLSTAYWEAFPMGIAEAQSAGLPCVIYDLPIEQAFENESIIRVPQGDIGMAANKILDLLGNNILWSRLSVLAKERASQYAIPKFINKIQDMISHFRILSYIRHYSLKDFRILSSYSNFYATYKQPENWWN